MNQQEPTGANQAPARQCSNPACQATFDTPVQHCLTCGALLNGSLLSERFRVEALLGRGGMGAVYRATDLALGRAVALKVLAPSAGLAGDAPQELRARFFREARLAAQLDHPNIVPVLHFDIDGPLAYLVMPLLTGGTLGKRLQPGRPTDPVVAAGWLHQLAAALDFAHQRPQPIVHRDVKPGNLLFHEDGRLCLADFGIARVAAGTQSGEAVNLTRTGIVLGSLSYMAPEQINGRAVPASDQYSAGVLLYETLTGALPFDAADNYGLIIQQVSATPPLPSEHVPTLPGGIDAVVLRALAKQPEERYPTAGALAEAFEQALTTAPTARIARPATMPAAPRPTLPFGQQQAVNAPFADDPRGDFPTEAAIIQRPPPGQAPYLRGAPAGAPPQKPPTARRRSWWIPALLAVLVVIVLGAVAFAGLNRLGLLTGNGPSATATAAAQAPTATPTRTIAQRYEALLTAAEGHGATFQDPLLDNSQHWNLSGSAHFQEDGLHLAVGDNSGGGGDNGGGDAKGGQNASARHTGLLLSDCAIEVDVQVDSSGALYGFAFLPRNLIFHIIGLDAGGNVQVARVVLDGRNGFKADSPKTDFNADLVLTPNTTYHLAVLLQGDTVSFFIAAQGQHTHYLLTVPYSPPFQGSGTLGLENFGGTNAAPATIIYSNLAIYPIS